MNLNYVNDDQTFILKKKVLVATVTIKKEN